MEGNDKYKGKRDILELVKWLLRNNPDMEKFKNIYGLEKADWLADAIYDSLNSIENKESFINLLIKNYALIDFSAILVKQFHSFYYHEMSEEKYEKIPNEEMEKYFELYTFNAFVFSQTKVMEWIFYENYGYYFDPEKYHTRIMEYLDYLMNEENYNYNEHNQYQKYNFSDTNNELKDYYKILNVSYNASEVVIKKAYKELVKKYHPDIAKKEDKEFTTKKMIEINEAYGVLSNSEKRIEYDKALNEKLYKNQENYSSSVNSASDNTNQEYGYGDSSEQNYIEVFIQNFGMIFAIISFFLLLVISIEHYFNYQSAGTNTPVTDKSTNEIEEEPETIILNGEEYEIRKDGDFSYLALYDSDYVDYVDKSHKNETHIAELKKDNVDVMKGYDPNSKVAFTIDSEEFFVVLGEIDDWYFGIFPDEDEDDDLNVGWVSSKYVDLWLVDLEKDETELIHLAEVSIDEDSINKKGEEIISGESKDFEEDEEIEPTTEDELAEINTEDEITEPSISYFTLGSSKDEVEAVMGPPDSIEWGTWSYDYSAIRFRYEEVVGWSDISGNLNVCMGEKDPEASPITVGSSKQEVIDAMGTPDSIEWGTWSYDYSTIRFRYEEVVGWSDISDNLKLE